jgi:DNA-binding IclR family transcriptional regulator
VLSISRGVGDSLKITQGSTGKAMLAFMESERQAEFLSQIADTKQRTKLEQGLQFAKRHGYATSSGEIFLGAVAVSAPYFDHRGSVVGSIGLYGPKARISDSKMTEYAKLVCEAGQQLSTLLGFDPSAQSNKFALMI